MALYYVAETQQASFHSQHCPTDLWLNTDTFAQSPKVHAVLIIYRIVVQYNVAFV